MIDLPKANYIEWNVKSVIKLNERDTYAYRVVLNYQDGTNTIQQKSGFKTKKEAEAARLQTIGELSNGTYIVDTRIKTVDFLEYWLEYDIRKRAGSENTYTTYSNIIQNHIVPILKKKKLSQLDKSDILRLYQNRTEYSIHIARQVKTVMNVSNMKRIVGVEENTFSMETTFAVQLMENREVRIFTGNTTNSYCRRQDFLIFGGMI